MQSKAKIFSFCVPLFVCAFPVYVNAQDNTLPTVSAQGTVTSPAKNLKSKTTTNVQDINDSGATGQSVTTITQGGGSSGDISVTTTNTINGDLTATGGTVVNIGDVNVSGSDIGTATVRTTTNMKSGDFKDGGTHEFGVVDLTNSELGKVDINTESNLQGNVKTKNNSSVSIGGVNVGNEAKQQQFEQNRGNMAAVFRPNNLVGNSVTRTRDRILPPCEDGKPFRSKIRPWHCFVHQESQLKFDLTVGDPYQIASDYQKSLGQTQVSIRDSLLSLISKFIKLRATKLPEELRETLNSDLPPNPIYAESIGMTLLDRDQSFFHDDQIGQRELKYVSDDGREAVYTCKKSSGCKNRKEYELMTGPLAGTYNFANPDQWFEHAVLDVMSRDTVDALREIVSIII